MQNFYLPSIPPLPTSVSFTVCTSSIFSSICSSILSLSSNSSGSIIIFFKQGSAPIRSKSNLFLKTPHTFQLRYLHRGEKADGGTGLHFKLNAFKECALQNVGVNYTPTGNYATYQDGTMVSYELTLGFSELEPIFNDDYGMGNGKEADDAIGF